MKDTKPYLLLFVLFFLETVTVNGQTIDVNSLRKTELKQYYKSAVRANDYYSQIDFLKALVKQKRKNDNYKFKLAEKYYQSRNYDFALTTFEKAYEENPQKNAIALFYIAKVRKNKKQYELAIKTFNKFLNTNKLTTENKKLTKSEIEGCKMAIEQLEKPLKMEVSSLKNGINHANIEFSPQIIDSNHFWFVALISDTIFYESTEKSNPKVPRRKIYEAKENNGEWVFNGEAKTPINEFENINIGSFALSEDKNRIYYTDCKPNWKNQIVCNLFAISKSRQGTWGKPIEMHELINSKKHTSTHPSVGRSSKIGGEIIYFVSDRKGGKGGLDIWYTRYNISKQKFDKPRNCGTKVNTEADEIAPSFDNKGYKLYFSSDGRNSIGGFDIQFVTGERSRWDNKAINAGAGINSSFDDMYYKLFPNRKNALIISNREGSIALKHPHCCDDIFLIKNKNITQQKLTGKITDSETGKPLDGVEIQIIIKNSANKEHYISDRISSNIKGDYSINVEDKTDYYVVYKKDGFLISTDSIVSKNKKEKLEINRTIKLKPIPKKEVIIPNILYDFDNASLNKTAQLLIDKSIYNLLVQNPNLIVEIRSHTDNKGDEKYNMKLSQRRASSVVNYLQKKGIDKKRLKAKGYGETSPIAPNNLKNGEDNPDGRAKNRRTSFKVIGTLNLDIEYND